MQKPQKKKDNLSKINVVLRGRKEFETLFAKSGMFDGSKLDHHPLLVFVIEQDKVRVEIEKTSNDLLKYEDNVQVMAQWGEKWRSDWFRFTVGDYKTFLLGNSTKS